MFPELLNVDLGKMVMSVTGIAGGGRSALTTTYTNVTKTMPIFLSLAFFASFFPKEL
jgi:hypothetical protein